MNEPIFKYEIALAGLLHDIGKLYQKTEKSPLYRKASNEHPLIAVDFIDKFKNVFKQVFTDESIHIIKECAKRHHSSPSFNEDCRPEFAEKDLKKFCFIIDKADNISSMERSQQGTKQVKEGSVMHPVMATYEDLQKEEQSVYNLCKFGDGYADNVVVNKPARNNMAYFDDASYVKHIDIFEKDFGAIKADTKESFFNKVLEVIGNYTRCVPSACNVKVHDVSLYQHLVTTSALASVIYNNLCLYSDNEEFTVSAVDMNKFDFSILTVNLDNVEDYILSNNKTGLDSLEVISAKNESISNKFKLIVKEIIDKIQLTKANCIVTTGFEQYIIVNNGSKDEISDIMTEINSRLIEEYDAELTISYSLSKLGFENSSMKSLYRSDLEEYHNGIVEYTYNDTWLEDRFVREIRGTNYCSCCGKLIAKGTICEVCKKELEASKKANIVDFLQDSKNIAIMIIDADKVIQNMKENLSSDSTISRVNTYSEVIANFFQVYLPREFENIAYIININANRVILLCDNDNALMSAQNIMSLFSKYTYNKLTLSIVIHTVSLKQRIVDLKFDKELRELKDKGGNLVRYNNLILKEEDLELYINMVTELMNAYSQKIDKSILQRLKTFGLMYKDVIDNNNVTNLLFVSYIYKDWNKYKVLGKSFSNTMGNAIKNIIKEPLKINQFFYMLAEMAYDVEVSLR